MGVALARSGVGSLVLIDLDEICISNTNRQLHALKDTIGRSKAQSWSSAWRPSTRSARSSCAGSGCLRATRPISLQKRLCRSVAWRDSRCSTSAGTARRRRWWSHAGSWASTACSAARRVCPTRRRYVWPTWSTLRRTRCCVQCARSCVAGTASPPVSSGARAAGRARRCGGAWQQADRRRKAWGVPCVFSLERTRTAQGKARSVTASAPHASRPARSARRGDADHGEPRTRRRVPKRPRREPHRRLMPHRRRCRRRHRRRHRCRHRRRHRRRRRRRCRRSRSVTAVTCR